jgi:hypothetical protein
MDKTQQFFIVVGFGIILLMGIFPPWSFVDDDKVTHSMGYSPIWKPPVSRSHDTAQFLGFKLQLDLQSQSANAIDLSKLVMQIAVVAAVTGGAVLLSKQASKKHT